MIRRNPTACATLDWRCGLTLSVAILALAAGGAAAARTAAPQETFASPEQAAEALSAAWHEGGAAALTRIFGAGGRKLIRSGDPVADRHSRQRLAAAYDKGHRIEALGERKAVLLTGKEEWPYPIPLVKQGSAWRFDVKAGAEEVLDRRVGRNELYAIKVILKVVEAQREFAAKAQLATGVREYAQRIVSTAGAHDGLYWPAAAGEPESALGPLAAAAEAYGYDATNAKGRAPFHGYYYRILTAQGAHAPGGARSYIVDGHMTRGFALIAFPATYGDSGVMTFMVNQHGVVFEKNLGPSAKAVASQMKTYDPDDSWRIVEP